MRMILAATAFFGMLAHAEAAQPRCEDFTRAYQLARTGIEDGEMNEQASKLLSFISGIYYGSTLDPFPTPDGKRIVDFEKRLLAECKESPLALIPQTAIELAASLPRPAPGERFLPMFSDKSDQSEESPRELAVSENDTTNSKANAAWRDEAVRAVEAEPKVYEALFPGSSSFWASVQDDGTDRRGYAQYLCLVLHDAGMPVGDFYVIHIWDAAAMARDELEELGRYECERN